MRRAPRPALGRRAAVRGLAVAAAFGVPAPPPAAGAQPAAGDSVVEFRLRDQFGRPAAAAEYRGRPLLLVGAGRGGRATGTAWVEAVRAMQDADGDPSPPVPVVAVADLRGLPRLLRRFVPGQFPRERTRAVLLDWDGSVARRLAFDPNRCTIVLVGPTGQVVARSTPESVDTAAARALLRRAAGLGPAAGGAALSGH